MMKRPSNVVLAFSMTVASSFLIWIGYLIIFEVSQSIKLEVEQIYESEVKE